MTAGASHRFQSPAPPAVAGPPPRRPLFSSSQSANAIWGPFKLFWGVAARWTVRPCPLFRKGDAVQAAAGAGGKKNEKITIIKGPTLQSVPALEPRLSFNCSCLEACAEKTPHLALCLQPPAKNDGRFTGWSQHLAWCGGVWGWSLTWERCHSVLCDITKGHSPHFISAEFTDRRQINKILP